MGDVNWGAVLAGAAGQTLGAMADSALEERAEAKKAERLEALYSKRNELDFDQWKQEQDYLSQNAAREISDTLVTDQGVLAIYNDGSTGLLAGDDGNPFTVTKEKTTTEKVPSRVKAAMDALEADPYMPDEQAGKYRGIVDEYVLGQKAAGSPPSATPETPNRGRAILNAVTEMHADLKSGDLSPEQARSLIRGDSRLSDDERIVILDSLGLGEQQAAKPDKAPGKAPGNTPDLSLGGKTGAAVEQGAGLLGDAVGSAADWFTEMGGFRKNASGEWTYSPENNSAPAEEPGSSRESQSNVPQAAENAMQALANGKTSRKQTLAVLEALKKSTTDAKEIELLEGLVKQVTNAKR